MLTGLLEVQGHLYYDAACCYVYMLVCPYVVMQVFFLTHLILSHICSLISIHMFFVLFFYFQLRMRVSVVALIACLLTWENTIAAPTHLHVWTTAAASAGLVVKLVNCPHSYPPLSILSFCLSSYVFSSEFDDCGNTSLSLLS